MQNQQYQEKNIEWQDFKRWIVSWVWILGYSCAISAFIIIPLNGVAHVLGSCT